MVFTRIKYLIRRRVGRRFDGYDGVDYLLLSIAYSHPYTSPVLLRKAFNGRRSIRGTN